MKCVNLYFYCKHNCIKSYNSIQTIKIYDIHTYSSLIGSGVFRGWAYLTVLYMNKVIGRQQKASVPVNKQIYVSPNKNPDYTTAHRLSIPNLHMF